MQELRDWIGRIEVRHDVVTDSVVRRIGAVFGSQGTSAVLPALGHWCLFLPDEPMAELGDDGHPRRGGFLPPVDLPRRMWAGGEVTWHDRLVVGDGVTRESTILGVEHKVGRTGPLVFVTVGHEISSQSGLAIVERQDLVFRGAAGAAPSSAADEIPRVPEWQQVVVPTTALLARYSALTFNAHRIHYDKPYAVDVEGYDDLVVQGPLLATMLARLAEQELGRPLVRFHFRAVRPVLANAPFSVCGARTDDGADLWIANDAGRPFLEATATVS